MLSFTYMEHFHLNAGSPEKKPRDPGEYAESYLANKVRLNSQIAEIAEKLAHNPGNLKPVYEDILRGLKEERAMFEGEGRESIQ